MRSLRLAAVVLIALVMVSFACAVETLARPSTVRALDAATGQAARTRLNKSTLRSLGAKITPTEQLRLLKLNPAYAGQTFNVPSQTTHVMSGDPWYNGITLTPLAPAFPAGATSNGALGLYTLAGMLAPSAPLPNPAQNPPTFWMFSPDNEGALFWIDARFPAPGAYLITFVMCDLFPTSPACPRVYVPEVHQKVNLVGNKTSGADKWTMLWNAHPPDLPNASEKIEVYPSPEFMGFNYCCLSKIVISRLP